jgi:hypothetical protein
MYMAIKELEIGAVGTDFSRRTSWWAREDTVRASTWKSMKTCLKTNTFDKFPNRQSEETCIKIMYFWMNLGVLNEKIMPDVAVLFPELETDKQVSKINVSKEQMWWYVGITYSL